jgi:hypothetical protein
VDQDVDVNCPTCTAGRVTTVFGVDTSFLPKTGDVSSEELDFDHYNNYDYDGQNSYVDDDNDEELELEDSDNDIDNDNEEEEMRHDVRDLYGVYVNILPPTALPRSPLLPDGPDNATDTVYTVDFIDEQEQSPPHKEEENEVGKDEEEEEEYSPPAGDDSLDERGDRLGPLVPHQPQQQSQLSAATLEGECLVVTVY